MVFSAGSSFHCLHATWHPLQPVHFVTSMSLMYSAMSHPPLSLLNIDKERLVFGYHGVRISDERGEVVGIAAGDQALIPEVPGDAHHVMGLSLR